MSGDGCYEPLSRENGHKIARWFTPKSKFIAPTFINDRPFYHGKLSVTFSPKDSILNH